MQTRWSSRTVNSESSSILMNESPASLLAFALTTCTQSDMHSWELPSFDPPYDLSQSPTLAAEFSGVMISAARLEAG